MVNEKDSQILFELLQDCRQPISKIAKAVKLPQQTVSYRIRKLEKEGTIKKYSININYPKLGYHRHSLYLDLKHIYAEEVDKYVGSITDIKEVSCCYMLHDTSAWKIYLSVWTKTIERYDEIQTKIIKKFRKYIKNYLSFQSVKSYTYLARKLNPEKKAKVDIKEGVGDVKLKDLDWKLIEKLKKDSRIPVLELAKELNATANTIIRRIKFLRKNDIIQRFYPIIDVKKLGYAEYTFISRIDLSYDKRIDELIEHAKKDIRFVIVIRAVGYVNLYYAFLTKDNKELNEIRGDVEKILGDSVLETHRIEVEQMLN